MLKRALIACLCCIWFVAAARPTVGDAPPAHVGTTLNGKPVLLTDFPGKALVISYWATWCSFCLKEMDVLNNIQRVGGDRVQVITVNIESRDTFRHAARALQSLTVLLAHDADRKGREAFGVEGIPHMIIVGKDGLIDSVNIGYSEKALDRIVDSINRAMGAKAPDR